MAKNPSIPTPKTPLIGQEHGREKPLYSDNLKGKAPIFRQLEREKPLYSDNLKGRTPTNRH